MDVFSSRLNTAELINRKKQINEKCKTDAHREKSRGKKGERHKVQTISVVVA